MLLFPLSYTEAFRTHTRLHVSVCTVRAQMHHTRPGTCACFIYAHMEIECQGTQSNPWTSTWTSTKTTEQTNKQCINGIVEKQWLSYDGGRLLTKHKILITVWPWQSQATCCTTSLRMLPRRLHMSTNCLWLYPWCRGQEAAALVSKHRMWIKQDLLCSVQCFLALATSSVC